MIQYAECPYCHTEWQFDATSNRTRGGSAAGFIWRQIYDHILWCAHATKDERRSWVMSMLKRHKKRPPQHVRYTFDMAMLPLQPK